MQMIGAMTVLGKEMRSLGLSQKELLIFIQRNPYAFSRKVIEAFTVYVKDLTANDVSFDEHLKELS